MRRKGGGSYYRRGSVWWVKYYRNGRPYRESTGSTLERDAKDLLNRRLGDIAAGRPLNPRADRIKLDELLDDLLTEYRVNERASLRRMKELVGHLRPLLGHMRAAAVTTADVNRYVGRRQGDDAANATINRELAALKRAYSLAYQAGRLLVKPHIPMLAENNVRTGFFEREQFEGMRAQLPAELHGVVSFAYVTGWRMPTEILTLQWRQIDFEAGVVRLEPGTTKNREGRVFPFNDELRAVLEAQRATTANLQRRTGRIIPWVFHRQGRPIKSLYGAWRAACRAAGVPGRIPHDFRRTAVRNLERAGVPRSVAMKLTGHKTEAVYRRYAIVSETDLREAVAKLSRASESAMGTKPPLTGTVGISGVLRKLAEGEGFEPPRGLRPGGFQVRCLTS
jgi:integrase